MWFRGKNWRVFLIPLILPLFLFESVLDFLRQVNHALWNVLGDAYRFAVVNPVITILCAIVAYLIFARKN